MTDTAITKWPTIRQAAERYCISEKTIRRRITDGTLKARRIGPRLIRLDPESIAAFGNGIGGAIA
ncbi:helix-turn-helix domain-containing protein [Cryobacterium sp. PH31-AA6]|uniref:helix-turn-helix domain-containing protein n=1 Tax=Cryobacterium sp. PH31-AA6 TaxID=3046205 RepID=UPI0024B8A810|nr:helix-turn-helix domain-containing protein [Cryobacterium sp. PH31-AA6]MDJ0325114.1 helix-turn-helix domain-containing protein [Cryobacterium sp. PH31-AA6]